MPVLFTKGPSELSSDAKGKLVEKTMAAIVEVYRVPDNRVYINQGRRDTQV